MASPRKINSSSTPMAVTVDLSTMRCNSAREYFYCSEKTTKTFCIGLISARKAKKALKNVFISMTLIMHDYEQRKDGDRYP